MLTATAKRFLKYQKGEVFLPNFKANTPSIVFVPVKGCSGTEKWGGLSFGDFPNKMVTSMVESGSGASSGVAFGTGTTAPTENDYTIESIISSGLTLSSTPSKQYYFDSENDKYYVYYDFTLANNTESDISISEVCLFATIYPGDTKGVTPSTSVYNNFSILIDRTVLETPIVIPAGESGVVRYSMEY